MFRWIMLAGLLFLPASRASAQDDAALIREIYELMKAAESGLNEAAAQNVIAGIEPLLRLSEKKQRRAIDKINELIRRSQRARSASGGTDQPRQPRPHGLRDNRPMPRPASPSPKDRANKFRSRSDRDKNWGLLPAHVREAIIHSRRGFEEFPPEFRELIKRYLIEIAGEKP